MIDNVIPFAIFCDEQRKRLTAQLRRETRTERERRRALAPTSRELIHDGHCETRGTATHATGERRYAQS